MEKPIFFNRNLSLYLTSKNSANDAIPTITSLGTNLLKVNFQTNIDNISSFNISSNGKINTFKNLFSNSIDIELLDIKLPIGKNSIQINITSLSDRYTYSSKNIFTSANYHNTTKAISINLIGVNTLLITFNNPILLIPEISKLSIYNVELPIKKVSRFKDNYNILIFELISYKNSVFCSNSSEITTHSILDGCGNKTTMNTLFIN